MTSFTICSNNYIYKAEVLASSIREHSNSPVYLFLADVDQPKIAYRHLQFSKVIFLGELGIPNLQWMKENYSIVEFNTAIKPFAFKYLFDNTDTDTVFYFDPDIRLYQPLSSFEPFWNNSCILLTPHILSPIPFDGKLPGENLFLNHGIYNLGFLALKRSIVAKKFLDWWSERLLEHCIIDLREGYFVDQIWLNLVPTLFGSTTVITHRGCNMAYWNLHERMLTLRDGVYMVNDTEPLIFYHFSSFNSDNAAIHPATDFRYTFQEQGALKILYEQYGGAIARFTPYFYKEFNYFDGHYPVMPPPPGLFGRLTRKIRSLLKK